MDVAAIIAAILGPAGIISLLAWFRDKKKPDVERKDAEAATAAPRLQEPIALAQGAMDLARSLEVRLGHMDQRNRLLEKKVESQDRKIQDLKDRTEKDHKTIAVLRRAISRIRDWWQSEIVENWDTIRRHPHPPDFPDIEHLEG